MLNRRAFLATAVSTGALAASARAQTATSNGSTPRDYAPGGAPVQYPDPDLVALDPRFLKYIPDNTTIRRHYTGTLWSEGPAWNGVGRYLVWSDIPNNVQMRFLEEESRVTTFRNPSGYSNGNTFDFEGRQLSCEHGGRRVVRYEYNGTVTIIADKFEGKRLNSPNDIVVHPDGGIWFTDPVYGILGPYEGFKGDSENKESFYRVDGKTGQITRIYDGMDKPNGICFSPDYKKLYICDTGATHKPDLPKTIRVYDVDGTKLKNSKLFVDTNMPGKGAGLPDGIRADIDGNIWTGCSWVGPGYDGVHIFAPNSDRIGIILLPEVCANLCFGGRKRNRLFMAASQSLYSLFVETRGAHIC